MSVRWAFIPYHTLSKTFRKLLTLTSTTPFRPYVAHSFGLQFCLYFNSSPQNGALFDDAACTTKHNFKLPQPDLQVHFHSSLRFLGIRRARHSSWRYSVQY